jgi:heme a synthase
MNPHQRGYFYLAGFTTFLALIVVMLGAYTRLGDAGLGCPDWPGCYGHLIVPETTTEIAKAQQTFQQIVEPAKAWKEMVHRYFAGSLGVLIVILTIWGLTRKKQHSGQPVVSLFLLVLLVIFQAVLGMWTVTWLVQPLVVSAHLMGGMIITALLWYVTLASKPQQPIAIPSSACFKPWAILALFIIIGQLFLGAWTSTHYAAIICTTFPDCHGSLFPPLNLKHAFNFTQTIGINYEGGVLDTASRITIQMMHRYGALITSLIVGILALRLICSKKAVQLHGLGVILLVVLCIQVLLGIANVLWLLPMPIAVAHNGMAAILLMTVVTLIYKLYRKSPRV